MLRKFLIFIASIFLLWSCHGLNSSSGKTVHSGLLKETFSGHFSSQEGATQMRLTLFRDSGTISGTYIFKRKTGKSKDSIFSKVGKFEIRQDKSSQPVRKLIRLNPDKIQELQDYLLRNDSLLLIFPNGKIAFGEKYALHK